MRVCCRCHGTGTEPELSEAEIAAMASGLRRAASALGLMATGDDLTDERGAAQLLGKKAKTLANWRFADCPIPYAKRRKRVLYAFADLARWMVENGESA